MGHIERISTQNNRWTSLFSANAANVAARMPKI